MAPGPSGSVTTSTVYMTGAAYGLDAELDGPGLDGRLDRLRAASTAPAPI